MSEQNLRQGLAIRGSSITHTTQNDDNRQSVSRFDTITTLLNERLVNFSPTETRQEEPMEVNHTRNKVCFECKGMGQRARFCPLQKMLHCCSKERKITLISAEFKILSIALDWPLG